MQLYVTSVCVSAAKAFIGTDIRVGVEKYWKR